MKTFILIISVFFFLGCEENKSITLYHKNGNIWSQSNDSFKKISLSKTEKNSYTKTFRENGVIESIIIEKTIFSKKPYKKHYEKFIDSIYDSNGDLEKVFITENDILLSTKYFVNNNIYHEIKFKDGNVFTDFYFNDNGQLSLKQTYLLERKDLAVRHSYKKGSLIKIDKNFEQWVKDDTILYPYEIKGFNKFGQLKKIGVYKPLTVEDDSDVFKDGMLTISEIFNYQENIGSRLANGRINGSTEIIHPKLNPNLKFDLRTHTVEEKTYWSSPEIFNEKTSRLDDLKKYYSMFTGVIFVYDHEITSFLNKDRKEEEKFDLNIDNELWKIQVYKDGLILFELWLPFGCDDGDFKKYFISKSFETNLNEYLTKKETLKCSYTYYLDDSNLFENKFEFRLGNFKDVTSPIVYDFNDLINSPQGKLIKVKK